MTSEAQRALANLDIHKTLFFSNFCSRKIGISYIDENPDSLKNYITYAVASVLVILLVVGQFSYVLLLTMKSASIVDFISGLHFLGYGFISSSKMVILWYKRAAFRQLVAELADLWPVRADEEAGDIKRKSLAALHFFQLWYTLFNEVSVTLFFLTPVVLHAYRSLRGLDSDLGYVWHVEYPFDKHQPGYHELAYAFEAIGGQASVFFMLSSDLLFVTMTSHISMLLRLLQLKIRRLGQNSILSGSTNGPAVSVDCYDEIIEVVKIHQRLLIYFSDLESAFSIVNLINIVLSSVNICAVVFVVVLLEPWLNFSNKLFLGSAVGQMGILCWYAEDICTSSIGIADAVYNSGWYQTNAKCRRALLFIIVRAHKPLYYTAMKFSNITMGTYASILTTAYSYFALLYTMYNRGTK